MTNRELAQRHDRITADREHPTVEKLAADLILAHSEVRHINGDPTDNHSWNLHATLEPGFEVPLWYLRGCDSSRVGAIARGGGPLYEGDEFHLYCPVCSCRKVGHPAETNGHDEPCSDSGCRCHDEDADEYQTCLEHPARPAVVETQVGPLPDGSYRWSAICNTCRAAWAVEPCRALTW